MYAPALYRKGLFMQSGILPRGLYNNKPQTVCTVLFLQPECVLSVSCVSRVFCLCVISLATPLRTDFSESHRFGLSCFHFHLFLCIFLFPFLFPPWSVAYSEACCLDSLCLYFNRFFFSCHCHLILLHCDQKRCLKWVHFFFNLLRLDLWPRMWSVLENVPCALEKKVKFVVLGWNVL